MAVAVVVFVFATVVECDGNGASGTNVDELPGSRVRTVCANMEQNALACTTIQQQKACSYHPEVKKMQLEMSSQYRKSQQKTFVKYVG